MRSIGPNAAPPRDNDARSSHGLRALRGHRSRPALPRTPDRRRPQPTALSPRAIDADALRRKALIPIAAPRTLEVEPRRASARRDGVLRQSERAPRGGSAMNA